MKSRAISGGVVHTVPADLRRVLMADPKVLAAWEDLTPLGRNEWLCWVLWPKKALHPPNGQGPEPFRPLGIKQAQQSVGLSDASAS